MNSEYRVVKSTMFGFNDSRDTEEVIWTGGVHALSVKYPIEVLDNRLEDPLAQSSDLAAGSTLRYAFQVWVGDDTDGPEGEAISSLGYWQVCEDPRPRPEICWPLMRPF